MSVRFTTQTLVLFLTLAMAGLGSSRLAHAQNNNNNNNNTNNNTNNNNNASGVAGIEVDAQGVLRVRQVDPRLSASRRQAALQARGNRNVKTSPLRKVSLNRLEKAVESQLASGKPLADEMLALAGLTRIEYVFYLPETRDIVIAGPAEEIIQDLTGRPVGLASGKPTLRLDDVIVALRTFAPDAKNSPLVSCSIDPTAEGLARMQAYLNSFGGKMGNHSEMEVAAGLRNSLGMQTVTLKGIPDTTHFGQVLVEADYRMKLIGIGLESPMVPLTSWAQRVNPSAQKSALQRWFFVADYSAVKVSPDNTALKLEGTGVKLVSESEHVRKDGSRESAKKGDKASEGFTTEFSQKFEKIADSIPVFHEMRNLFDLSVAAAFIQSSDLYAQADWKAETFSNERAFRVETVQAPKQVEPAVHPMWRGSTFMAPIGGGVHISTKTILSKDSRTADATLNQNRGAAAPTNIDASQWWWD